MARFNTRSLTPQKFSPITSEQTASGRTYNGAPGFKRDVKSELFLLAVTNMVGTDTFYERARTRDDRYAALVRELAVADPTWTSDFLAWLRTEANMRSASIVGAAEFAYARLAAGEHGISRQVVDSVLQRVDEPGELLGYCISKYGTSIPKPVKRGVADALIRLGNEFNYLKYGDSSARALKWRDVINLCHPGDKKGSRQHFLGDWQRDLFGYVVNGSYDAELRPADSLQMLTRREALMSLPVDERRAALEPVRLREAGMTWESLAGWLQGPMDKQAWEAIIPNMGYMALLRNLRNFDQAGVSDTIAQIVAGKLSDPAQVSKSRQLPMRFLSAHRNAPSLRWGYPLEQALNYSLNNIPLMDKSTLILVDTSSSMQAPMSDKSDLMRWDAAAIFGIALASRACNTTVVSYSSRDRYYHGDNERSEFTKVFPFVQGESVLRSVQRWESGGFFLGGGTMTQPALEKHYRDHARVVILTDEQADYHRNHGVGANLPANVPLYTWNLSGYEHGHASSGQDNRHTFGGLTDAGFKMIPLLEAGKNANWPWMDRYSVA